MGLTFRSIGGFVGTGFAVVGAALCAGCVSSPPNNYRLPAERFVEAQIEFPNAAPQIERGRPIALVDGLNHYVLSLPAKLVLWNWRVQDHRMEPDGEALLQRYLELNRMTAVKVRHNAYAPLDEFRRLRQNTEVGAGYRYTFGILGLLYYTIVPDRLFGGLIGVPYIGGGDHFNPFSNTINVFSSDPAILLHEAGHAKDYLNRRLKGTTFILPRIVIPGWVFAQEARASADAVRFLDCVREPERELAAYGTLFPAYGTYIGGFVAGLLGIVPGAIGGHIAGEVRERKRTSGQQTPEEQVRLAQLPEFCVAFAVAPEVPPAEPPPAPPAE